MSLKGDIVNCWGPGGVEVLDGGLLHRYVWFVSFVVLEMEPRTSYIH
jgi:hypothetical protein